MGRKTKYGEPVKDVTVTLPQTAIENLDAWANKLNMTRSELIANIGLSQLRISQDQQALGESLAS